MIRRLRRFFEFLANYFYRLEHAGGERFLMFDELWIATCRARQFPNILFDADRVFPSKKEAESWGLRSERPVIMQLEDYVLHKMRR